MIASTIFGSSQPILPCWSCWNFSTPATLSRTGSTHWVGTQTSLAPTEKALDAAFALSRAAVKLGPGRRGLRQAQLGVGGLRGPDQAVHVALEVHGIGVAVGTHGDRLERLVVLTVVDPGLPLVVEVHQQALLRELPDHAGQRHRGVGRVARGELLGQLRLCLVEGNHLDLDARARVLGLEAVDDGLEGLALDAGPVGDDADLAARLSGPRAFGAGVAAGAGGCQRYDAEGLRRGPRDVLLCVVLRMVMKVSRSQLSLLQ